MTKRAFDKIAAGLEDAIAYAEGDETRVQAAAKRGRPPGSDKVHVTLRLDKEVVDYFKAGGRGWQTRINEVLRKAAGL